MNAAGDRPRVAPPANIVDLLGGFLNAPGCGSHGRRRRGGGGSSYSRGCEDGGEDRRLQHHFESPVGLRLSRSLRNTSVPMNWSLAQAK